MKKDIAIIRESITKIVNLLTNRSIKVTQRGSKAFVQYKASNGAIELVNIPYLPDDASEEYVAAVQGFLDHEVGHVLFTDPKIMPTMRKESEKVKNLSNAIEDVYIERKMAAAFQGSIANLNSVRRFYLDKVAKVKIDAALAAGDKVTAAAYAGLVQFRAWGGQQMAADFLQDNPSYAELTIPMTVKLGPELIAKVKKANTSWECLDLARAMTKKLSEKEDKPEEKPEGKGGKGEKSPSPSPSKDEEPAEPGDDDSSSSSEDGPEDDKPEPEDKGTTRTEKDDSDKKRDEKSETDEPVDSEEAGDTDGKEGGDRDEETGEPTDKPKDEPEDDDEKESSESGEKTKKEEGADAAGDKAGETESDDPDADEDGPTGHDGDDEGTAPIASEAKDATKEGTDEDDDDLSDLFKESRDFDDELSKALTKEAVKEIAEAKYQIFSTDWDVVEPAPKAERESSVEKMVDKTQHMVASIQKGLERALAAKARKTWNPGQRRGRISPSALFKTAVGDDRIFRQRYETHAKNTAVSLLVDCSGSMMNMGKMAVAGHAAFALSSTLQRLKITHEVIGFTTKKSSAMNAAMSGEGLGITYARREALYLPVFKGFNEKLGVDATSRIAHLTESDSHEWLRENVDGECLQIAARRLKTQIAERHLLIVLSDGCPACPGNYHALSHHLKDTAAKLAKDSGVEVVGIGILDGSVRGYYDKFVVLNDLAELPTTVVGELAKVLLSA